MVHNMDKKLTRSTDDKKVAGVAAGIAAYFGIDAMLVRVLFVLFALFSGFGLFVYLVLWIFMPEADNAE